MPRATDARPPRPHSPPGSRGRGSLSEASRSYVSDWLCFSPWSPWPFPGRRHRGRSLFPRTEARAGEEAGERVDQASAEVGAHREILAHLEFERASAVGAGVATRRVDEPRLARIGLVHGGREAGLPQDLLQALRQLVLLVEEHADF